MGRAIADRRKGGVSCKADYFHSSQQENSMEVERGREQYVVPVGPGGILAGWAAS